MFRHRRNSASRLATLAALLLSTEANEYQWTVNSVNYPSDGRRLAGHVTATYANVYEVTQCAFRCRKYPESACASFNFLPSQRMCEINSATHVTDPTNFETTSDSQYYLRDAFFIDEAALGPCVSQPCLNGGTCLTKVSINDTKHYSCVCGDDWTGSTCDTTVTDKPIWGSWSDWTPCSTTCGDGVKLRQRRCVTSDSGTVVSSQLCYGREQEETYCTGDCPAWTDYGPWSQCSTDDYCGQGILVRTRSCTHGGTIGVDRLCMGPSNETTICQSPSCDVPIQLLDGPTYGEGRVSIYNDVTNTWLPVCANAWTKANADVVCRQIGFFSGALEAGSYGVQSGASAAVGDVSCLGNEPYLPTCPHATWSDASCAAGPHAGVRCIVDGRWGPWSSWGDCSVSCADGTSTRTRLCDSPPPLRGGKQCDGDSVQTKPCTMPPCPVDASWTEWQTWSPCSRSCGGGNQTRTRSCNPALFGGQDCLGDSVQSQACNTQHCPVDGVFGEWSAWQACSVTCGNGTQNRYRVCTPPQYGGLPCVGASNQTQACFPKYCPVDGSWNAWSDWGQCNVSCGGGTQSRARVCNQPLYGGAQCPGSAVDYQACNQQSCAIDGVWQEWGAWSSCNATCGSGTRVRVRQCYGPFYGGLDCPGDAQQQQFCNDIPCPVDGQWSAWTRWLDCSVTCSIGIQQRYRVCYGAANGGNACPGNDKEQQSCDAGPCPVNCTWLAWGNWSTCNTTCGGGIKTRTRSTIPAQYGGAECFGSSFESQVCNTNPCPIPGLWTPWSDWSLCSVTCGTGGQRSRSRTCNMTSYGSLTIACLPQNGTGATETKSCHQFNCTPAAASCRELYQRGFEDNNYVTLDPDRTGTNNPFTVYCERNGSTIITTVHTSMETPTLVSGYEGACEYMANVLYVDNRRNNITVSQLVPLVDVSTTCRQFIQWRCVAATINSPDTTNGGANRLTFWKNRDGLDMGYWGGAAPVAYDSTRTVMCPCGESHSCANATLRCNCDMNDNVWRSDDGFISNIPDLPVKSFCAGDTGSLGEQGYYVVGPLICTA